jgi:translation initiation factor 4E
VYIQFRDKIAPKWESPECANGGEWMLTLNIKQKDEMDTYWVNAVLACIGENFDDDVSPHICGCCVAIRKAQLRISLWIGSCDDKIVCIVVAVIIVCVLCLY